MKNFFKRAVLFLSLSLFLAAPVLLMTGCAYNGQTGGGDSHAPTISSPGTEDSSDVSSSEDSSEGSSQDSSGGSSQDSSEGSSQDSSGGSSGGLINGGTFEPDGHF